MACTSGRLATQQSPIGAARFLILQQMEFDGLSLEHNSALRPAIDVRHTEAACDLYLGKRLEHTHYNGSSLAYEAVIAEPKNQLIFR